MTTEPTPLEATAAEGMRYLANAQAALPSVAQTGANLVAALGRPAVVDLAAQIREVLPPPLFDRLRAALFAILESGVDLPCETVERVAKELGIKVSDG